MNKYRRYFWRWGSQLASRVELAMPLLLGLVALLSLTAIWWLGPHWIWREQQILGSVQNRVVASLLVVVAPLLCWAMMLRWRVRRLQSDHHYRAAVQDDPGLPLVHAQERALNRALANYLENAGGRRALYRLPWYMVLGAKNAGKTSFVTCSDQSFSLTRISKVQARSHQDEVLAYPVDWWISNDAVIIDPPGELIVQEPGADAMPPLRGAAEARLWKHLLGWLVQNRSRRALNGLVLVVDLAWLLEATPEQRLELAHVLRTRLYELSGALGSRLPLYVVLAKLDLLEGFDQLFARMTASQREQVLGFTFQLNANSEFDAWLDDLGLFYDQLIKVSEELVLDGLSQAVGAGQRERLLSFHAQLVGLRPALVNFLREALAGDRFTHSNLVRGMYWSSVLQEGETNNAFVRAAAQPYNIQLPLSDSKRAGQSLIYFAQKVFQRLIYPEAGLAGDNAKVVRQKRRLLWVSSAVGLLAFVVAGATWQRYFDINRSKAASVLAKSQDFSGRTVDERLDTTGRNLLAPLDQIRDAVSVFGDYRSAWPLVADFGLYQGRAIGPMVDQAYLSLLSQRFLPALAEGVVESMNTAADGSEQQMAALRVYRMLEDRENRRSHLVEEWMAHKWQSAYPGQGTLQRNLMQHLQYALAYADADMPHFRQRIAEIQQMLRKVPMQQRVYSSLKHQAQDQLHTGLSLRNQIGPVFDVVYQMSADDAQLNDGIFITPLLTARGFKEYFTPRSEQITEMAMIDQWALGERRQLDYSDADRNALTEQIRALYSADYIDNWRRAIGTLAMADFRDLNHAVSVLENMTGPAAPMYRLLATVRDNTIITEIPLAESGAAGVAIVAKAAFDPEQPHSAGIRRAFASLNHMLDERGDKPTFYDETQGAISAVYEYAKAVQDSPDRGKAALSAVLQRFSMSGPDPIATLQRVATGLPEPVRQQVKSMADQTAQVLVVEALRELERRWDADVYSFFQQRLAGRYPFVVQAPDASLDDFVAFFGPKGRLQQFQEQYLAIFIKDNLDALYTADRSGYLIRTEVMQQLEAADRIRETFFDHRGSLSVQFSIEPLGLSANQRTSLLDLDGQLISYTHGPSRIAGVIWPNTLNQQVRSNLTLLKLDGNSSSLEYRGPWSMFRLLSRGSLNGRTATSVDLSFRTGDGMMRYQLRSEKAFNPITQQPFKDFRLPRTLLRSPKPEVGTADLSASR